MYDFDEEDCPFEEFVEETYSERFWGALSTLPYADRMLNVAGSIKKHFTISASSQYYRNIGWWTLSTATVLFLPIFIDKAVQDAVA
ncbi:unnamed protein product [Macrosiphum euphorbiae]|uniref:Mitochondrial fission process protein 1 n=1 Tax=Macrosiphum euphorbiae TaxID=13131 RepID=A0AAV0VPY4_9HEMI|nr:unnamed protein product [Macrosiphum euphorbiae]